MSANVGISRLLAGETQVSRSLSLLHRFCAIVAAPAAGFVQPDMFIVGAKTEQNKMRKRRRNMALPSFLLQEQGRRHDVTYLDTIRGLEGTEAGREGKWL